MDADLLAKIAENKKKALARKRQRESPETPSSKDNNNKPASVNNSPIKPTTPALTDAIYALATEFTAFREQVNKRQKLEDDDKIENIEHKETQSFEITPNFKNKTSKSTRLKSRNDNSSKNSGKLSFTNSQTLPLPSSTNC